MRETRSIDCNIEVYPEYESTHSRTEEDHKLGTNSFVGSLREAVDVAKKLRNAMEHVVICLRPGTHFLEDHLQIGAELSSTTWQSTPGAEHAIVSGGVALPRTCWKEVRDTVTLQMFSLTNISATLFECTLERGLVEHFRASDGPNVVRIGDTVEMSSRYPNGRSSHSLDVENDELNNDWMKIANAKYLGGNTYEIVFGGHTEDQACWRRFNMHGVKGWPLWFFTVPSGYTARVQIMNKKNWHNMEATMEWIDGDWDDQRTIRNAVFDPSINMTTVDTSMRVPLVCSTTRRFRLHCSYWTSPLGRDYGCSPTNPATRIGSGDRIRIFQSSYTLSNPRDWWYDTIHGVLYVLPDREDFPDGPFNDVVVPKMSSLLRVGGDASSGQIVNDVTVRDIRFADTDYTSNEPAAIGFQAPFGVFGNGMGIPRDAAVHIHSALNISLFNVTFSRLGGGGVLITNSSQRVHISECTFEHLGQSGILLTGDERTQPKFVRIEKNNLRSLGSILSSAGGIVCSSCSDTVMSYNNISRTSRWGVHIRNNFVNATMFGHSRRNVVEFNRFTNIGLRTDDLGAISVFSGNHLNMSTSSQSILRFNSICDVEGKTSYGIYLDNCASGWLVEGNLVVRSESSAIMVHGGSNNQITGNVFVASNPDSNKGHIRAFSSKDQTGSDACKSTNISFTKNIVFGAVENQLGPLVSFPEESLSTWDYNVYYTIRREDSTEEAPLTPGWLFKEFNAQTVPENHATWVEKGFDIHSKWESPRFRDVLHGDLGLTESIPLGPGVYIESLPDRTCRDVCDGPDRWILEKSAPFIHNRDYRISTNKDLYDWRRNQYSTTSTDRSTETSVAHNITVISPTRTIGLYALWGLTFISYAVFLGSSWILCLDVARRCLLWRQQHRKVALPAHRDLELVKNGRAD